MQNDITARQKQGRKPKRKPRAGIFLSKQTLDTIERYGEIEPMSEELARMIAKSHKLWCYEFEPMTPELSRLVDNVLYPQRRRVTTKTPRTYHKRCKPKTA